MYDAAIAGAGPAGSTAALLLQEAGVNVVILEKKKLPRNKPCGGGVVQRARKLLAVDIGSVVERELGSATISLLLNNLSLEVRRNKPLISMTTRASLDHLLAKAAQNAGAEIREGTEVRSVSAGKNRVTLQTMSGPVEARFVIAADGANSVVAKTAGWPESRLLAPALEEELYVPDKQMVLHENTARFDFDMSPFGYAWLFPKNDHLSVGILSKKRGKVALKTRLGQYLEILGLKEIRNRYSHGAVIPLTPRRDRFARDRVILVGDSAGFADPVTAEGISFAIKSGQFAARALLSSNFDAIQTVNVYEKAIRQKVLPELASGGILAKLLYSPQRLRTWIFRHYGEKLANAVADIIEGKHTYHELLHNPRNYLKLLVNFKRSARDSNA